jgi:hypothetical protein
MDSHDAIGTGRLDGLASAIYSSEARHILDPCLYISSIVLRISSREAEQRPFHSCSSSDRMHKVLKFTHLRSAMKYERAFSFLSFPPELRNETCKIITDNDTVHFRSGTPRGKFQGCEILVREQRGALALRHIYRQIRSEACCLKVSFRKASF